MLEKRSSVTLFKNTAQNGQFVSYHTLGLLFVFVSLSLSLSNSMFLFFCFHRHQLSVPSDSISRRRCPRHLDDCSSISLLAFIYLTPSPLLSLFLSLTLTALEELEVNRTYTTHFTSLIRKNSSTVTSSLVLRGARRGGLGAWGSLHFISSPLEASWLIMYLRPGTSRCSTASTVSSYLL